MSTISAMSKAVAGIKEATQQTDRAAERISRLYQSGADNRLPEDIVDIKTAKTAVDANAAVIKQTKEMEDSLLDILA